jgi:hypothetical protein
VKKLGYAPMARAESFYVSGTDGPLLEGELARAEAWGRQLGIEVKQRAHQPII